MFQVRFVLPNLTSYEAKVFTIPRKGERVDFGVAGPFIVLYVAHSLDSSVGDFHRVTIYLDTEKIDLLSREVEI